jgi:parallel beta-helix repeat protein
MRVRSIGFLLVLATGAVFAGPAQSDTILGCGSTLTESMTLERDIGPCPEGGLAITGGDVTLDLNGHSVTGSGRSSGILITVPGDGDAGNVTVTNGSLSGFDTGIAVRVERPTSACPQLSTITLDRLEVRANETGMSAFGSTGCGANVTVSRNTISGNSGDGIDTALVSPIAILGNRITGNGQIGVHAFIDSARRIEDNVVSHNGADGVNIQDSVASIIGNTMSKNGGVGLTIRESISWFIPLYLVANNVADSNGSGGMSASSFPDPPAPPAGNGNEAKHNALFQCLVIICAPSRGQAKTQQ